MYVYTYVCDNNNEYFLYRELVAVSCMCVCMYVYMYVCDNNNEYFLYRELVSDKSHVCKCICIKMWSLPVQTHTHACFFSSHTCVRTYICMWAHIHTYIHTYIQYIIYTHTHNTSTYLTVTHETWKCTLVKSLPSPWYIYIYIYIHTHTHTNKHPHISPWHTRPETAP